MTEDTPCAVVCNGLVEDYSWLKQSLAGYDFIIAADGGSKHLEKAGVRPDVVIGDMDSSGPVPAEIDVISYPPDKDFTDTELSIQYARDRGMERIDLYGALGDRGDHTFCNILLLASYPHQLRICDPGTTMRCCVAGQSLDVDGKRGDILSLLPLSAEVSCTAKNLKYELKGETLQRSGRGMSNLFTGNHVLVSVHSGELVIIHVFKEDSP